MTLNCGAVEGSFGAIMAQFYKPRQFDSVKWRSSWPSQGRQLKQSIGWHYSKIHRAKITTKILYFTHKPEHFNVKFMVFKHSLGGFMRSSLFLALLLLLTSCATNQSQANRYTLSDQDKLPPITLAVSAGRYITAAQAETVEHIAKSVQNSGLFSAVETNFARHPLVLLISYKCDIPNDAANFANTMLSAATLFVVPSSLKKIHTIEVEFVLGKKTLFKKSYTQEHSVTMSLYTPPGNQQLAGVNLVINQFLDDIKTNKVLPSMSDFPQPSTQQQDQTI